jgi:hypothetical protein
MAMRAYGSMYKLWLKAAERPLQILAALTAPVNDSSRLLAQTLPGILLEDDQPRC